MNSIKKISVNNQLSKIEHPVDTADVTNDDLLITDGAGFSIAKFVNGHIKTKCFDSSLINYDNISSEVIDDLITTDDIELVDVSTNKIDFLIEDEDNNCLVRFKNGHILTKNFNSEEQIVLDNANADLLISDENHNNVMILSDGHIFTKNFNSEDVINEIVELNEKIDLKKIKTKISYLAIGNSVNQDVAAYIPYLLKTLYGDDIDFEIAIAFIGSYTIKDYVERVITKTDKISVYSYANNTDVWTNESNRYYLEDVISMHDWNMISFLMYQTQTTVSDHPEDVTLAPQLLSYIKSHARQDCIFGLVTPATYTDMRSTYITWQLTVLTNCALDFFIDYGATKELMINAGISKSLMCTDGYHSNEGFPCITLSLTAIHIITKLFGIKDRASNLKERMTSTKHSTLHILNQNGQFTTTTESNWTIGIDSAVNGFRISNATMDISNQTLRNETL